jgi:Domain of unknown function (DUF397)
MKDDLTRAAWRKSTHSGGGNECAEVAALDGVTAVRDTKNRAGGHIAVDHDSWRAFLDHVTR